jgi:hypothetical protein
MKRPANKVIIPKINSIIILSFLFRYKIEQSRLISKFYLNKKVTQGR